MRCLLSCLTANSGPQNLLPIVSQDSGSLQLTSSVFTMHSVLTAKRVETLTARTTPAEYQQRLLRVH